MSFWNKIMKLTASVDLDALERLCKIVDATVAGYAQAGAALREIRDRQLFRATHKTFEDFCRDRWEMTPQHANRIIAAATVAQNLEPLGSIPHNERLARPLTRLEPQDQVAAWNDALIDAGNDPVRPEHVERAVSRRKPKTKKAGRPKPIRLRVPGGIVIVEPSAKGFESAERCLEYALQQLQAKRAA